MRIFRSVYTWAGIVLTVILPITIPLSGDDTRNDQPGMERAARTFSKPDPEERAQIRETFARLPLSFEANRGQADAEVQFLSRGSGYQLYLTETGATLQLRAAYRESLNEKTAAKRRDDATNKPSTVRMKFANANPKPRIAGRDQLPGRRNYYIGNDPKNWLTDILTYAQVEYEKVWPGIDLVYYGNQRQLEYDVIVAPGADPNQIKLVFDGADDINPDAEGNLILHFAGGEIAVKKPFIYQDVNGTRQPVKGGYRIQNSVVGFHIGEYDTGLPLVIDPVLVYSTYLGPASLDIANDIAVDQAGNVCITGASFFTSEGWNAFVAKLNAAGTALVYSTAFIGGKDEVGFGVAVDSAGNAYATGYTRSTNFPVKNAFQSTLGATDCRNSLGCSDAFVAKLDAGGTLVYSTYLGGNDWPGDSAAFGDEGHDIAVDNIGQAYVTGFTVSANFPVKNAYQPSGRTATPGKVSDGFITKFNAAGNALIYSTYLGGTGIDDCSGIAIDTAGNAYVTGDTYGDQTNNFPTTQGAFQRTAPGGSRDAFVTKLNPAGNALVYSTFLGGTNSDQSEGIAVDSAGIAYIIGSTSSTDFPLEGAHQSTNLGGSAFVTKLNPNGSGLLYSSYFGKQVWFRTGNSHGAAIAVDAAGIVSIVSSTTASDFPLVNPLFSTFGGIRDAYVARINTVTKSVVYATFLGGNDIDEGYGIALDAAGNAYVTGRTHSTNFPLFKPVQATPGGNGDVFVTKISANSTSPQAVINLNPTDLSFDSAVGADNPPSKTVLLTNTGSGTLNWQATARTTSGGDWLSVSPASGSLGANQSITLSVSVDIRALFSDLYSGTITVSSTDATNSPREVKVNLLVGCPVESALAGPVAAVPSCSDILRLDDPVPPGSTITAESLKSNGLKAKITYGLISRKDALLFLRVFDQEGSLIGSSEVTEVKRPDPVPDSLPPALSKVIEIPGSAITLRPNSQTLKLYALYIDPQTSAVFKRSQEVAYYLGTLRIETADEVFAGKDSKIDITALKRDGSLDSSFRGVIQVSLAAGSTDKIGKLEAETQSGKTLSLPMENGKLKQILVLVTPEDPLKNSTVINSKTVLEGKAIIKAEIGNFSGSAVQKDVKVRSPLDLMIDRIEVQQGVRQGPAGLWVKERDLLVRVFLKANREGPDSFDKYSRIEDITAKLTVKDRTGAEIIGSPFTISGGRIGTSNVPDAAYVFVPKAGPSADGSDSLNYVLGGTLEQQLSLEVKLNNTIPERDLGNNSALYGPLNFGLSRSVTIVYARLRVVAGSSTEFADYAGIDRELEFMKQSWPVATRALHFIPEVDEVRTKNPFSGDPFSQLFGLGFYLSSFQGIRYVYFVDSNYFSLIHGAYGTDGVTNKYLKYSLVNSDKCSNNITQCGTLAHEVGHTFSLGDTYTNLDAFGNDDGSASHNSNNPRQANAPLNGNLVEMGNFNWFRNEFVNNSWYADFMGNSGPFWVDLQTWNYLKSKLLFTSSSLQATQADFQAASTFVIAQGQINKNGTASFSNCYTLTLTDPEDSSPSGDYVIETLNANSAVLNSLSFTPGFRLPHTTQELDQADFSFALPFSNAVRQIRLRSGSTILASRAVSANAPTVKFISDFGGLTLTGMQNVSWAGSDPDGDALTYSLFYSPDGKLRIPLTETTQTSYAWKTDNFASGPSPMLTLVATDGVNSAVVDSRPFNLPNRPPRVSIFSPGDQFQFKVGEPVTLEGSLFDPEEDFNLNPQLQWSSNLQGALGTGKRIKLSNLRAGTHLITASGLDGQGASGSASVTVIVRPDNFSNIEAAPGTIDFGSVAVGQSRDFRLSVNNTGNFPFTVNNLTSNSPHFVITSPAPPFIVAERSQQEVIIRYAPLTAAIQAGTLTITSDATNRSSISVSLAGKATGAAASAVASVSAASYQARPLAAESIVSAFGTGLATGIVTADKLPLPTTLAGTTVRVKDSLGAERLAPLFYVSPDQINYEIPAGTAIGVATVTIISGNGAVSIGAVRIVAVAPGLFSADATGQGIASALLLRVSGDGSQSYEPVARFDTVQKRFVAVPIEPGPPADQLYLILFGTGLRNNGGLEGVTCKLGGVEIPTLYAGAQGGYAGLDQINIGPLPRSLEGRGELDLMLTVDGQTANPVRIVFGGAPTCKYVISPTSKNFDANINTGVVNVMTDSGCAWTATSNAGFITITGSASGAGNGVVNYSVAANMTTSQRSGTITIAGQTFTVTQAAASPLTVVDHKLTGGPIPGQCSPPAAKTAFLTTDQSVYQWTLVSGAHIGDQVRWEFAPVGGTFLQTQQYTVAFDGGVCFWGVMSIAGFPAASLPGNWEARVYYNNALLFTENFSISNAGVSVTDHKMTGGPIPDQCISPVAKTSFAPSDGQAYQWTLLAGAKLNDLVRWEFIRPDGTLYTSSEYTIPFNGGICLWAGINIAGTTAASTPGNWQVRVLYNGKLLLTENFMIKTGQ